MPYIDVNLETEPVELASDAFDYLETKVPGWLPSPGNLEAWLIESLAQIAGELRVLCALVPESIFQFYGDSIMGIPPYQAVSATALTTWTAKDDAGYEVLAGTVVGLHPPASSDVWAFEVMATFVIPAGQTVATVTVQALVPGAACSGLTGTIEMIDVLDFIQSVELSGQTQGGQDAETATDYLDRLSDLLTILAPTPILPQDFAIMAEREVPGVARCCAIDLYNADTGETNVPRCCTVVPIDSEGEPVSDVIANEVDALLESQREINFLVFVDKPTYTTIAVTFAVVTYPNFVADDVVARVTQQLQAYFNPASWGLPPPGTGGSQTWLNETEVRYLEVAEQVNLVPGVHYIESLTIGVEGGAMGTADLVLTGVCALTRPGAITGTATVEMPGGQRA